MMTHVGGLDPERFSPHGAPCRRRLKAQIGQNYEHTQPMESTRKDGPREMALHRG